MRKSLLAVCVVFVILLAGCGLDTTPPATAVPTDTPTPSFPALGEWVDILPYSFLNDSFALIIAIQQANSTNNVASITSIIGSCGWDSTKQANTAQPDTFAAPASDTINGSDITLSANVTYPNIYNNSLHESTVYMQFTGVINADGSLALVSSQLGGVQDYTFTETTGAVAQVKSQFEQGSCS